MGLLLQLVWLILIAGMIFTAIRALVVEHRKSQCEGLEIGPHWTSLTLFFLCFLPLFVFLVTNTFLMFSHPTVQFTTRSKLAGELWSIWSHYWHILLGISFFQIPAFVIVTILTLVGKRVRDWRVTMSIALLSAILGTFVVAIASPRV